MQSKNDHKDFCPEQHEGPWYTCQMVAHNTVHTCKDDSTKFQIDDADDLIKCPNQIESPNSTICACRILSYHDI